MSIINRTDYLIHFLCGCFICYVFFSFGWWWSLAMVALAGGIKEVYDMVSKKGDPDWVDFASTVASFPVVVLVETIKSFIS